jgi:uncharacterized membrane protein YcaP (DUF421 family)
MIAAKKRGRKMEGWFDLSLPWWQFVVRAAISYLGVLILMRAAGKHTLGKLSPFEMIVLILVGGTMRTAILGDDKSLLGPFIAITTIIVVDKAIAFTIARSSAIHSFVSGTCDVLAKDGSVDRGALLKHDIAPEDFAIAMRQHGLHNAALINEARLESNGKISFLVNQAGLRSSGPT